jgi:3',5'-cyclic AMP phosphodiesterase CpdA
MDRRRFLLDSGRLAALSPVAAAGLASSAFASAPVAATAAADSEASARRVLRFAHFTDVHIQPEKGAKAGLAEALEHAQSLDDPPALIVTGGDAIMDAFAADRVRTQTQWDLWTAVLKDHCSLPVLHTIGNHDIWGWDKSSSSTTGDEPKWGKAWAIEAFDIPGRYYHRDQAGWRFIILDSVRPDPDGSGYLAFLDDQQYDWLAATLRETPADTPVCIVSHIPIITVVAQIYNDTRADDRNTTLPGSWVHLDALRLKDLFAKHSNVKLCLSGHMHRVDHCRFNGVGYICDGAVSGSWWNGDNYECEEGYGLIDLYEDGAYRHQYVPYHWTPRA